MRTSRRFLRTIAGAIPTLLLLALPACDFIGPFDLSGPYEGQVVVTGGSASNWLATGETIQYTASVWHKSGGYQVVEANWSSRDPDIASVDSTGLVRALAPGFTVITAEYRGRSGVLGVQVVPNFTGMFTVRLTVDSCEAVNGFASSWCDTARGTEDTMALDLQQTRDRVAGTWRFRDAAGTFPSAQVSLLDRTGRVTLDANPVALAGAQASILLSLESDDGQSLTGTFTAQWFVTGQPGWAMTGGSISGGPR